MSQKDLYNIYLKAIRTHWKDSELKDFLNQETIVSCVNFYESINEICDKANLQIVPLTDDGYDEETKSVIIKLASKDDINNVLGNITISYNYIRISYCDSNDMSECISNINFDGKTINGAISRLAGPDNFVAINVNNDGYSVSGIDKNYSFASSKNEERIAELYNALEMSSDMKLKYIENKR